jgi:hypothetical protein
MSKIEYRVVTVESPEHGYRLCLGTFDTKDWGGQSQDRAESAARSFAAQMMESRPGVRLEIEVVFTKSETIRIIRL